MAENDLKRGYPKDAKYDYAWPVDYPYDADPKYPGGSLFAEDAFTKIERLEDREIDGKTVPVFRVHLD